MIYRGAERTKTYRLKRYSVKIEPIENRLHAWNRGKKRKKKKKKKKRSVGSTLAIRGNRGEDLATRITTF